MTNVADATELAPAISLFIDGKMVMSKTDHWRSLVNPATQEVIGRVPFATPDEVEAAVASSARAFATWRKTPIGARARIFLKYQELIRKHMKELALLLTTEQGKTSSIHFLHFPFTAKQIESFRDENMEVVLAIGHSNYGHMALVSGASRAALATDLD